MFIPIWLVKIFAWITVAVIALGCLTVLLLSIVWLQDRFFRAAKLFLAFHGTWAAYINFTRVQIHAAEGGKDWFNSLIRPQDLRDCVMDEGDLRAPAPDPIPYFSVVPRPELWRWWMRLLGAKKPQPNG